MQSTTYIFFNVGLREWCTVHPVHTNGNIKYLRGGASDRRVGALNLVDYKLLRTRGKIVRMVPQLCVNF